MNIAYQLDTYALTCPPGAVRFAFNPINAPATRERPGAGSGLVAPVPSAPEAIPSAWAFKEVL